MTLLATLREFMLASSKSFRGAFASHSSRLIVRDAIFVGKSLFEILNITLFEILNIALFKISLVRGKVNTTFWFKILHSHYLGPDEDRLY